VDGFSIRSYFFSNIMKDEKKEMWKKHVPYVVQRVYFDQTFFFQKKSLMGQVHGGAKASADEGRFLNTNQIGGEKEKNEKDNNSSSNCNSVSSINWNDNGRRQRKRETRAFYSNDKLYGHRSGNNYCNR